MQKTFAQKFMQYQKNAVIPVRSISQDLFSENALAMPQLWLFIVAPMVGAALAGVCYKCNACDGTCKK